jgi:hypothetical protein
MLTLAGACVLMLHVIHFKKRLLMISKFVAWMCRLEVYLLCADVNVGLYF